jgi:hypothetical protein
VNNLKVLNQLVATALLKFLGVNRREMKKRKKVGNQSRESSAPRD